MRLVLTLLACAVFAELSAQNKRDYVWFFGKDQNIIEEGIQGLRFDFNQQPWEPSTANNGLEFDQNNASICDEEGNLLFYTNGCAVADRNHQIMPNGDSINAGVFFDLFWLGDCGNGYPGGQDITILPDPGDSLGYYILHKPQEYMPSMDPRFFFQYFNFSYVDMRLNQGFGDVVIKNQTFHESRFLWSYLTSINHANGKDWWVIQPKETDNYFYTYLIDGQGIQLIDSIQLGNNPFNESTGSAGDAKFSPDGTKYVFYNMVNGMFLYDFDRAMGTFSNFKFLDFTFPVDEAKFSSVEFSPNSRFLYLSNTDTLWQVDTWEENLIDGLELIDVYDRVPDPFSTSFAVSTLGPDCRIYIRPLSSSNIMHVINSPDEKGVACDFVERGIRLPQPTASGSYPNFPRFRIDEDEVCDPTITTFLGHDVYYRRDLRCYPNPAKDFVHVALPDNLIGALYIYDMLGQIVVTRDHDLLSTVSLDISSLQAGYYTVEFVPKNGEKHVLYNAVIIKE